MQLLIVCQFLNVLISMFFNQFLFTFSQSVITFYFILDYPNSLLSEQKKVSPNQLIKTHCKRLSVLASLGYTAVNIESKTPVTHPRMPRRIAAGFFIWKIVSYLRIIFNICILY